jgi:epsin
MIYRRFTEKSAEEWRQIYKALQLLEFLIKHGSERVIDDARSHLTLLKMLRQFHFIDQNGKDQGINVRNRAKELADLLGDVDRIRAERKKARANKTKYTGVEGGGGGGFSSSSRYGGFGSESGGYGGGGGGGGGEYGGYSGGVYGDGGGFGGQASDFRDTQARADKFEEYDEFDEAERPKASAPPPRRNTTERVGVKKTTETTPKKKEPEVDLFSFDDPVPSAPALTAAPSNGSGLTSLAAPAGGDDDEFDDFQSATPAAPQMSSFAAPITSTASGAVFAAPQPVSAPMKANLGNMVGQSSISPPTSSNATPSVNYSAFSTPLSATTTSSQMPKPTGYQASTPNYFQSVQMGAPQQPSTSASLGAPSAASAAKPASGGDAFGSLWSNASTSIKKTGTATPGTTMGQLAKEKSSAGIWGTPSSGMGSMSSGAKPMGSSSNGLEDLL